MQEVVADVDVEEEGRMNLDEEVDIGDIGGEIKIELFVETGVVVAFFSTNVRNLGGFLVWTAIFL